MQRSWVKGDSRLMQVFGFAHKRAGHWEAIQHLEWVTNILTVAYMFI